MNRPLVLFANAAAARRVNDGRTQRVAKKATQLLANPLSRLLAYLLFELWLIVQISGSPWVQSEWAKAYVEAVSVVAPAVHHLDRIASDPAAVAFSLAISPFLIVPKVILWVQWLYL